MVVNLREVLLYGLKEGDCNEVEPHGGRKFEPPEEDEGYDGYDRRHRPLGGDRARGSPVEPSRHEADRALKPLYESRANRNYHTGFGELNQAEKRVVERCRLGDEGIEVVGKVPRRLEDFKERVEEWELDDKKEEGKERIHAVLLVEGEDRLRLRLAVALVRRLEPRDLPLKPVHLLLVRREEREERREDEADENGEKNNRDPKVAKGDGVIEKNKPVKERFVEEGVEEVGKKREHHKNILRPRPSGLKSSTEFTKEYTLIIEERARARQKNNKVVGGLPELRARKRAAKKRVASAFQPVSLC